jgi:hypothetical protein
MPTYATYRPRPLPPYIAYTAGGCGRSEMAWRTFMDSDPSALSCPHYTTAGCGRQAEALTPGPFPPENRRVGLPATVTRQPNPRGSLEAQPPRCQRRTAVPRCRWGRLPRRLRPVGPRQASPSRHVSPLRQLLPRAGECKARGPSYWARGDGFVAISGGNRQGPAGDSGRGSSLEGRGNPPLLVHCPYKP